MHIWYSKIISKTWNQPACYEDDYKSKTPVWQTYLEKNTQQESKLKCLLRNVDEKLCE